MTPHFKRLSLFAATMCGALMTANAALADVSDFLGNWTNTDSDASGVTRMVVSPAGPNRVRVRVFGQCHPVDCDWGEVDAHSYFDGAGSDHVKSVLAVFDQGFAKRVIVLRERMGDKLSFEILTDFTDGSGRRDYDMTGRLDRAMGGWPGGGYGGGPGGGPGGGGPGGGPGGGGPGGGYGGGGGGMAEDCLPEDWSSLAVAHAGGAWKIINGSEWVLDFGMNKPAADRSLAIIQHYRFDHICYVKRPGPAMTYWTRNGHVPSGGLPGDDCIALNPMTTHAAFVSGRWKVVDGSNWLLDYGSDGAAAHQAEAVIHNYNLNRQCFVARPNPPMQYWLSQ